MEHSPQHVVAHVNTQVIRLPEACDGSTVKENKTQKKTFHTLCLLALLFYFLTHSYIAVFNSKYQFFMTVMFVCVQYRMSS